MIMNTSEIISLITERLLQINPYRVIVFGSFASGEAGPDSDIDLIVVLNRHGIPVDYNEKMENHRSIRRLLRDINEQRALDIIVFTIDEWNSFVNNGSYFSRVIIENGKAIA